MLIDYLSVLVYYQGRYGCNAMLFSQGRFFVNIDLSEFKPS